ncbi:class I SAM-dependent methyltransferase [Lentzea albidocapillata]|uniref:Methyltransferase domain-containing protein n=1 Tax=Lentzea albidocapillata TaxID=40571 RepID=A0A1W2F050_9PSEU|nr:class I SAM-dependent methyltransferase [Lentzea albidocapillata]SMD14848.1 Methyltransferase domain-containing protein [Lentzea albidocapillata]
MGTYLFGGTGESLDPKFDALSSLLDAGTFARVEQLGVSDGWRCLEVGGGGGSVANWLADVVAPAGHVTVTDIDVTRLEERDNVTVLEHDVVSNILPGNAFDLVHARLVLFYLPARDLVLRKLRDALRPGGWLVLEEFDCLPLEVLSVGSSGAPEDAKLIMRVKNALLTVLDHAGAELAWGARVEKALRDAGLNDVSGSREVQEWEGGSAGCRLLAATARLVRAKLPLTDDEFDRYLELMASPETVVSSYAMCSAQGRR